MLYKIAIGVRHLHSRNIIHRDLKLENILFSLNEFKELQDIKIVDFGLATYIDSYTNCACGTPA